jgi:hypothetical protein
LRSIKNTADITVNRGTIAKNTADIAINRDAIAEKRVDVKTIALYFFRCRGKLCPVFSNRGGIFI